MTIRTPLYATVLIALVSAPAKAGDPGACCFDDGSCSLVASQAFCESLGGIWVPDVDCSTSPCVGVGACCLDNVACVPALNATECETMGGSWVAGGILCDDTDCANYWSACCFPDGTCELLDFVIDCFAAGGEWRGIGTSCTGNICLGACCLVGDCQLASQNACDAAGGVWQDFGSSCTSTCVGACCYPNSTCEELTELARFAQGGDFNAGLPCNDVDACGGTCCLEDGSCVETFESECVGVLDGVFDDGASCDTTTCPVLLGACCFAGDGTCFLALQEECFVGWQGAGTDCDTVECPIVGGACCMGSSCVQSDEFSCSFVGGVYLDGESCAQDACNGACCLGDAGCLDVTTAACFSSGGCFSGMTTSCAEVSCPEYGATRSSTSVHEISGESGSTATSVIEVALTGQIVDVGVSFSIEHTYVGDLCITLFHDDVAVSLLERPGDVVVGCFDGFGSTCPQQDYDVTVDDAGAGGALEDLCSPEMTSPPSYTPHDLLSELRGTDAAGIWALTVTDWADADGGALLGWSIRITTCTPLCAADLDGNGEIGFADLLALLAAWGPCAMCPADFDADGVVGFADLLALLAAWGPC